MTDRKYYLWLIPGVLLLGIALVLVLTFQPVLAGNGQNENFELIDRTETGAQRLSVQEELLEPQAVINPTCTLDTTTPLAISHWPLNETGGPPFLDALAGNHDGSCSEGDCPTPTTGTNAGGQFFIDTDEDGITVPSDVAFDFEPADSFSAGIWVKTTQNCMGNKVYIGRFGTAYTEGRWWLGCVPGGSPGEGVARFHMRDSTYENVRRATGNTQINDGEWHYLTGVWDGTDTILYVDGAEEARVSSPAFTGGSFTSSKPITIGAYDISGGGYFTNGVLDEAAVFDSALSESFIDDYIATCDFSFTVGDVTIDTTMDTAVPITAAQLLANTTGGEPNVSAISSPSVKNGSITGTLPDGPFLFTPDTGYFGTDFFRFEVTDGDNSAWGNAIVTMEAPLVTNPGPQANLEGEIVSLQITAVDANGDSMTHAAVGLPADLSININSGLISGTVASGAAGLYDPVTVTVTDAKGHSSEVEFTWTITVGNLPPEVTNPGDQANLEGEIISLQISATDPNGDALTYTATDLPPGLSIHPNSGLISGTISAGATDFSPYTVKVKAEDPGSLFDEVTFSWTVNTTLEYIYMPVILKSYP